MSSARGIIERDSNLELYRIIVMLAIVAHHYVVNSGLMDVISQNPLSSKSLFYYLFGAWGKTGINCFVLITGYFMCGKDLTIRKFLKLFLEILFYNIIIWLVFLCSGYQPFSEKEFISLFLPIKNISTGFTSCFLAFMLLIPFLNILVRNMTRRQHLCLVAVLLFIYSVLPLLFLINVSVTFNYVSWFCVLYFVGSYLRIYPVKKNENTRFWRCSFFVMFALGLCSIIGVMLFNQNHIKQYHPYMFISDSNQLLSLAIAVSLFMWFKNIKLKNSRAINTISASCFGVLLIHANSDTMRQWLWKDVVDCAGHYDNCIYAIICVFGVYMACTIIDIIRAKTIKKPALDWFERICFDLKHRIVEKCSKEIR